MKNSHPLYQNQNRTRPVLLLTATLLAIAGSVAIPRTAFLQDSAFAQTAASPQKLELMFVQTADDIKVDPAAKTIRLVNVSPQTLYFADRPERVAGNIPMAVYLDTWKAGTNPDNFANDPPNATLSIREPGQKRNNLVVVEISKPVIAGKDLIYSYKLIEGSIPQSGGQTAVFIDWVGAGGGVGPGYHGQDLRKEHVNGWVLELSNQVVRQHSMLNLINCSTALISDGFEARPN